MKIETKYRIGQKVLLTNGKIETIHSIHYEPASYKDFAIKYHFERFFASFKWEKDIVKGYDE